MSDLTTIPPDDEQPEHILDIFLFPGDIHWGDSQTRIITILGSCVSITLWHPQRKEGGMCHFLLPARSRLHTEGLSGRYGEEAMEIFLEEMKKANTKPEEYTAKIFGGGTFMEEKSLGSIKTIGMNNVEHARTMLGKAGIPIEALDTGGLLYRKIVFQLWSGNVWVKRQKNDQPSV